MAADVTVVVVTFRGRDLLPRCLAALRAQTREHRLLVVDNGSQDGTSEVAVSLTAPAELLRLPENRGFAGGVAAALEVVQTRYLALLNDDAEPEPDWLAQLVGAAEQPATGAGVGAWTSLLLTAGAPDVVQNAGIRVLPTGYGTDLGAGERAAGVGDAEVFGFCGGAALIRTEALRAAGGFPAEFFLYYEDLDTSWRLRRAGWTIRRVAGARVTHAHSATADQRSALFHRMNERNRLWCLIRNAPASVCLRAAAGFLVTTASIAARRLVRAPVDDAANMRLRLRLAVAGETIAGLGSLVAQRRRLQRMLPRPRALVWRQAMTLADAQHERAGRASRRSVV